MSVQLLSESRTKPAKGRRGACVPAQAGTPKQPTISDCQVGCPIRRSRDRRVLSPPPGLSQSATSFIASCCQGIHQTPLSRLIRSRRRRALLRGSRFKAANPFPAPGCGSLRPGEPPRQEAPGSSELRTPEGSRSSRSVSFDLERLLSSPRTSRPSAGTRPTWQMPNSVSCFALFTMSIAAISRSDRKAHHRMNLPIKSPSREWWVGEELNLRPHAYQACALTT